MKALKYIGIVVAALILLSLIGAMFGDQPVKKVERFTPSEEATPEVEPAEPDAPRVIAGLNPVDVYLNLEKRGFKVEKNFTSGALSWKCVQAWPSVQYESEVFGTSATEVTYVRSSVMADGVEKTALAGKDFLALVSSVPYTGAEPQKAHDWVMANYDQHEASIVIGSARFTIKAPTVVYRMLILEPA